MSAILIAWAAAAALLVGASCALGRLTLDRGPLGILVDNRGRMSLTHLQLVVWSTVLLSLILGVFFGRLVEGVANPLGFTIPDQVLGLMGISGGSGLAAGAVKAAKNRTAPDRVASAANTSARPTLRQVIMLEEGQCADEVIDMAKFQKVTFTVVLVVAYVAVSIHALATARGAAAVTSLPTLSGAFLVLLGISYSGYVGSKLPSQAGLPGVRDASLAGAIVAAPVPA